jgi:Molecular chaperone (small heat shock protein)
MDPIKSVKLRWLQGALHDITTNCRARNFPSLRRRRGNRRSTRIDATRAFESVLISRESIVRGSTDVEPRRLVIRGTRELPEPTGDEGCAQQLLAMEIDYGPFEREITFPVDVEIDKAHAEQRNGLLWISLPVRKES